MIPVDQKLCYKCYTYVICFSHELSSSVGSDILYHKISSDKCGMHILCSFHELLEYGF